MQLSHPFAVRLILQEKLKVKSETIAVQQLFQDRRQYRVPFYQRTYVWNKEDQWGRLWADIQDKAEGRLADVQPVPHFLGAAVLEPQPRRGLLGVEALHIIDGQQRLTTLQYILAALAIVLRECGQQQLLSLIDNCLRNPNAETMEYPQRTRCATTRHRSDQELRFHAGGSRWV